MSDRRPRLLLDECISPIYAKTLRRLGFDAVQVNELGREGLPDLDQIAYATEDGRAIVTFNYAEFRVFHRQLLEAGEEHGGIIISADYKHHIGAYLRDLAHTLDLWESRHTGEPDWIRNQLVFLQKAPLE